MPKCVKTDLLFQVVCPYFVATKMSKIRKGNFFAPFPDSFVRSALSTVGVTSFTFGCMSHALQVCVFRHIAC